MKTVEVITYSLRAGQDRSDQFYRDLALFTDEVSAYFSLPLKDWILAFQQYLQKNGIETPRTDPEYRYELLSLGVLWRIYAGQFQRLASQPLSPLSQRLLAGLARLRDNHPRLKPPVDFLRGWLMAWTLSADQKPSNVPTATVAGLHVLLEGLSATGNYTQVVGRLENWRKFLAEMDRAGAEKILAGCLDFAAWFERRSEQLLGSYTQNVERFLEERLPGYRGRQDYIFCGRKRVEYHLNMVGTEILNRSFRSSFLVTRQRVVVVPPCMSAPADKCLAKSTPFGSHCAACTPGCRVNQLTKLGEKRGFQVFILPDEMKVFAGSGGDASNRLPIGIVGVSCVLTNASGGWDMKDLGIPAQGVFLDYCGCSYHWHKDGIPTDVNFQHILQVLDAPAINS